MKKKGHILIIDDDKDVLFTAKTILKREYETVTVESSPNRLESLLHKEDIDLVILDMNFKAGITSGNEGLFWLRKIREMAPDVHVLMNTAYGEIGLAVESMKLGAVDFLVKPWEKEKLISTVRTVFQLRKSQQRIQKLENRERILVANGTSGYENVIFNSDKMQELMGILHRVAVTDASVLLLGENGTGKEVFAREIHRISTRVKEPLIKVDLGTLSESLFESEMFGHVKGSFTDAKVDKAGRFEIADGGTLFLDEIGNLSLAMQAKLLTAIQNRQVNRVGSSKIVPFDVRLISATNMPLYDMIESGEFRQDLIYRINTVEIEIPPLRSRKEDIAVLVRHYLEILSNKYQKPGLTIAKSTQKELNDYHWPGNVRELQHAVERAVIMSKERKLETEDFLISKRVRSTPNDGSLSVSAAEKQVIERAITESEGNMSKASEALGIGRTTLYRKIKKYGLNL
jgi:DNA-binding NtrC family response regulator